ncbi:MAG: hypothetical protein ACK55Z_36155, partial [bacterium]
KIQLYKKQALLIKRNKMREALITKTKEVRLMEMEKKKVTIKRENQTMRMMEKSSINNIDSTRENLKKYSLGISKVRSIRIITWNLMNK